MNNAISNCTSLEYINIGSSLSLLENGAIFACQKLVSVTVDKDNPNYKTVDGNLYSSDGKTFVMYMPGKSDTSFTVPAGVNAIGDYAFYYATSLERIELPSELLSIGERSFYGCSALTSAVIPDSVTTIGVMAYASCTSLSRVTLGRNLTTVKDYAFDSCNALTLVINRSSLNLKKGSYDYGWVALNATEIIIE